MGYIARMTIKFSRRRALQLMATGSIAVASPNAFAAPTGLGNTKMTEVPRAPKLPREMRSICIHPEQHTAADEVEGKKQIKAEVDRYAAANFTHILPWTTTEYLTALDHEEYRKDHPTARWNSLQYLTEEASKAGLEVHLWYSFTEYRQDNSPEFNTMLGGNPEWKAKRLDEIRPDQTMYKFEWHKVPSVCPQHFAARKMMQTELDGALARFPKMTGLHIEEPGYATTGYCVCDLCQSVYKQLNGENLPDVMTSQKAEDFRTLGCSAFMEETRDMLAKKHPDIVFSANGGFNWRHDRLRGRDWGRWALSGWLRYYISQVYQTDINLFREQLALTLDDIGEACPVIAGIAIDSSSGKSNITNVTQQIEASRELGAPGVLLFHGAAFTDADLQTLKAGPFEKPA
jgi:uncharacterized lipoprotein YddW (UPF0748 family)